MDRIALLTWLAFAAALAGCRGHPTTGTPTPAAAAAPEGAAPASVSAPGSASRAPAVHVEGAAEAQGRGVAIIVQNHAAEAVELAAGVGVERRQNDATAFQAYPQPGLRLRPEPATGCIRLAPGAELRTPWPSAQAGAPPGTYRFVVHGCDGSYHVASEPFDL